MRDAARGMAEIAAMDVFSSTRFIEIHIIYRDGTVRENFGLINFKESANPYAVALL